MARSLEHDLASHMIASSLTASQLLVFRYRNLWHRLAIIVNPESVTWLHFATDK